MCVSEGAATVPQFTFEIPTLAASGLPEPCSIVNAPVSNPLLDQNTVGFRPGALSWIFSAVSVSCPGKVPAFKITKFVLCAIQGLSFRGQERAQLYVFRTTDWRRDSSPCTSSLPNLFPTRGSNCRFTPLQQVLSVIVFVDIYVQHI